MNTAVSTAAQSPSAEKTREEITNQLSTVYDPLLTEIEVEEQSNEVLKAVSLRNWRSQGKHLGQLPFVKIGSRVFYRKSVIERALAEGVT